MRLVAAILIVLGFAVVSGDVVSAASLKIAPQSYESSLQKGEVKKGYIDISNPESTSVRIKLEVQAFRQIDDQGSLEFFDSEQIKAGVKLDFETMTLGPREAYRVYFLLDASKLPSGDVFASLFASTIPADGAGSRQATRVGTLLLLQNGTPPARNATISTFVSKFFQVGDGLSAVIKVTNPAGDKQATGYVPNLTISTAPYGSKNVKGPLVFAGRTRTVNYATTGNYFGPMWFAAQTGDSSKGKLIFAVTGYWRWLAPLLLVLMLVIGSVLIRVKRKK